MRIEKVGSMSEEDDLFGSAIERVKPKKPKGKPKVPKVKVHTSNSCKGCVHQWRCVWKDADICHRACPAYLHYLRMRTGTLALWMEWKDKVKQEGYL